MPQGRVSIGLPTVRRGHPDVYALEVMNEILGGSGFTSRITKTVRSNEGLAYSAGSGLAPGVWFPGRFRAGFQSKSRTVPWATELVFGEIRRIRDEGVTAEELATIKSNIVQTFPSSFASKAQAMGIFAVRRVHAPRPGATGRRTGTGSRPSPRPTCSGSRARTSRPRRWWCSWSATRSRSSSGTRSTRWRSRSLAPGGKVETLPLRDPMTMK